MLKRFLKKEPVHPPKPTIDIVLPIYNEASVLNTCLDTLQETVYTDLKAMFDIKVIAIDDGSTDETLAILKSWIAKPIQIRSFQLETLEFSKNFGKEMAIKAGLDHANGQATIVMDCDLEDPVDLIPAMIEEWKNGSDIVYTVRELRKESWLKRLTAWLFYKTINALSNITIYNNAGDFRLFDKKAVQAITQFNERTRFSKGLFNLVGFKSTPLLYTRVENKASKSKWSYFKLWKYALDGIFSFSTLPLKTWSYLGFLCSFFSAGYLLFIVTRTLIYGIDVPGYASLVAIMLFFNGIMLVSVGMLGEYIARIFEEVKQRPHYIIKNTYISQ